jgi:hypothetical protein
VGQTNGGPTAKQRRMLRLSRDNAAISSDQLDGVLNLARQWRDYAITDTTGILIGAADRTAFLRCTT